MFLKNSRSSVGVGAGVCARKATVVAIVNKIMPKRHCDLLFLRIVTSLEILFSNYQHRERARFDAALRSATRRCRRRLDILRRTQKNLLRFRIESHGPCAWL